jgi:hypothetical protein
MEDRQSVGVHGVMICIGFALHDGVAAAAAAAAVLLVVLLSFATPMLSSKLAAVLPVLA